MHAAETMAKCKNSRFTRVCNVYAQVYEMNLSVRNG